MFNKLLDLYLSTDKYLSIPIVFSLATVLAMVGSYLIASPYLPKRVPLYYSLPWGQSQLVPKEQFLILPGIILAIVVFNSLVTFQIHTSQLVIRRMLMLTTIAISLIILITAVKILFIFI